MLNRMTQRDAELPTEQGGLPNEHTPGRTEATGQGPVQELASGELLRVAHAADPSATAPAKLSDSGEDDRDTTSRH